MDKLKFKNETYIKNMKIYLLIKTLEEFQNKCLLHPISAQSILKTDKINEIPTKQKLLGILLLL